MFSHRSRLQEQARQLKQLRTSKKFAIKCQKFRWVAKLLFKLLLSRKLWTSVHELKRQIHNIPSETLTSVMEEEVFVVRKGTTAKWRLLRHKCKTDQADQSSSSLRSFILFSFAIHFSRFYPSSNPDSSLPQNLSHKKRLLLTSTTNQSDMRIYIHFHLLSLLVSSRLKKSRKWGKNDFTSPSSSLSLLCLVIMQHKRRFIRSKASSPFHDDITAWWSRKF